MSILHAQNIGSGEKAKKNKKSPTQPPCTRCNTTMHTGGQSQCPFKGYSNTKARKLAADAISRIDENLDFVRACELVLNDEKDED